MSDRFWEDLEEPQEIICDIEMLPENSPSVPCMKIAMFTMEDKTVVCEEHKDMLELEDGLTWTPGVNREE